MEDGTLRHLEFESDSIAPKDLRRFREYEAYMSMAYQAPVITSVICSSGVEVLRDSLTEGLNTYRVEVIRLKDRDADVLFRQAEECFFRKEPLTRSEFLQILLTPKEIAETLEEAPELVERICETINKHPECKAAELYELIAASSSETAKH